MTRLLAIDWDRREARCILAESAGKKLKVLGVGSAPQVDVAEGGSPVQPDLGGSLRAAVDDRRPGRAATLVGIDRASVDLMNFALPPATDAELPELIANQAMRESQLATEEASIDFVALSDDPAEPRPVIAAVLGPEQRGRIEGACSSAGLRPQRIVLRALAAASLVARSGAPEEVRLLLNVLGEEADLTLLVDGRAVLLRTVRLPAGLDDESAAGRLLAEVQRTVLVAQQGALGGRAVERLVLFGGPDEHPVLADRLREDLSMPVSVLDPFRAAGVPSAIVPENPGRYASLLGMLLDEADGKPHAIDFLHPKRPPKPLDRRRPLLIAAALAMVAALAVGYSTWSELRDLDDTNEGLAQQLRDRDDLVREASKDRQLIEAVRQWKASDVNWLDELRDLSERFPSMRQARVTQLSLTPGRSGGQIHLQGLVRDPGVAAEIERRLREAGHEEVRSKHILPREGQENYTRSFEISASVPPGQRHDLRQQASAR
jgi:Tfp pilus assembly PilM family ATPase